MKPIILLFVIASVLIGCGKELAPASKIERPALTLVAGSTSNASAYTYSGEICARFDTQLGFRIGGKIVERLVDTGARVKAGQALMRLDTGDAALQLASAEAQHQLIEAEAKRYRDLRDKGFVSQSALDAKESALKTAAAQAGLARNQSAYTTLRADRAGVIAATLAEVGQMVATGQPVLRLAPDGEREVAIAIPESQLANLKVGQVAEIFLLSSDVSPIQGRLRELSPASDPASRTYAARVALKQPGGHGINSPDVALGMTARVRFPAINQGDGLLIPLSAIFQQDKQTAVWIVAADYTISLRKVRVAAYRDDGAIIKDGLAAGERIVSNGVHRLASGEKIRLIESAQ